MRVNQFLLEVEQILAGADVRDLTAAAKAADSVAAVGMDREMETLRAVAKALVTPRGPSAMAAFAARTTLRNHFFPFSLKNFAINFGASLG